MIIESWPICCGKASIFVLVNHSASRTLHWETCFNVRDLGGLSTEDGGATRFGALVRADSLSRLTQRGCLDAEGYGIRTIIDLRGDLEVSEDPSPFANHAVIDVRHLSLDPNDRAYNRSISAHKEMGLPHMAAILAGYLATSRDRIAEIMRAVGEAPEGGVLVHCAAGRDRTGLISALLLAVARVPAPTIVADYILSFSTNAETMEETLGHLEIAYGGVEQYLIDARMHPEEIERVRARLCG
jgi:protein tyrosine/serine phosphatase